MKLSSRAAVVVPGILATVMGLAGLDPARAADAPKLSADQRATAERLREELRELIAAARDRVFPSLVNISVVTLDYYGGKEHKGRSVGSGTIISAQGHVLTNQHVTNNGKRFRCTMADKQEVTADLVGEDPLTDLAVLKLHISELQDGGKSLPVAQFGNSDELQIGDYVMAMGSPFALARSVTLGIVSNPERVFAGGLGSNDIDDMELSSGQSTGLFTRWIQHDANINPGNSGGPLVNLNGDIVGINELGGSSMGFAIPANLARKVAESLIAHGEVPRSSIGVSFKPIDKTGLKRGVLVNSVTKGGPADQAGIKAGDVVLSLNDEALTVRFPEEVPPLLKRVAEAPIGSKIKLSYQRGTNDGSVEITTARLKNEKGDEKALRTWGMTISEITEKMALEYRLDTTEGAMVFSIRPGGPASLSEPAIGPGDIIRSVDRKPVRSLPDLVNLYNQIMERKPSPEYVLVEFDRSGKNNVTLLKPRQDDDDNPPREVPKAWIGIATQPIIQKLSDQLRQGDSRGFRVTRVYPRTTAADSGLKVGDIITALNGDRIIPKGMQDAGQLGLRVRKLSIGDTATLTVLRSGKSEQVKVVLDRTRVTPEEAAHETNRDFEMTVREITFFDRDENRWSEDVQGVIVQQVEPAGWAGLAGVGTGDLIQSIGGREVKDLKTYRQAMDAVTQAQPERVVFVVLRGVRTRFQYAEPEWKPVATSQPTTKSAPAK